MTKHLYMTLEYICGAKNFFCIDIKMNFRILQNTTVKDQFDFLFGLLELTHILEITGINLSALNNPKTNF
jgi:hypothetical protein